MISQSHWQILCQELALATILATENKPSILPPTNVRFAIELNGL